MDGGRVRRGAGRAALAAEVVRFVHRGLAAHPGRFVALAVGDSTLPLYAGLDPSDPGWAGRTITPVDELVPPPADPARTFGARLAAALPEGLRARLAPLDPAVDGADLCAVVLGLGPDGHIAFNQPPTPVDAPTRVVTVAPANLARLGPVEPARSALTLGVAPILAAGSVLVVAAGPGKEEAFRHLVDGPEDPAWPATWLRRHPRLTVVAGLDVSRSGQRLA